MESLRHKRDRLIDLRLLLGKIERPYQVWQALNVENMCCGARVTVNAVLTDVHHFDIVASHPSHGSTGQA